MASRTSTRHRATNGAQQDGNLPGSIAMQARVVAEELERLEYLRTRAAIKQAASKHGDDHPYSAADEDGEVLSYSDYLKFLDDYARRLKDATPPAAWRLAQKRVQTAAAQNAE